MKAILTKPEKERLLEQFEKSGKTHAQFAEENGLNVKTLSKWIYEWHHQIKTTNEVKFVEIKTTAISSVNDIRIKKSGMEILIPADLEQYQLKNILTVLASIRKLILRMRKSTCAREVQIYGKVQQDLLKLLKTK